MHICIFLLFLQRYYTKAKNWNFMKRLFYIFFTIVCYLSISVKGYSQKRFFFDDSQIGKTISCELLESNASSYKVKVNIHGLYDNIIENEFGFFHLLSLDGGTHLMDTGNPSLPCLTQLITIPPGSEVSVSIIEENWTETEVGTVYPTQAPAYEEQRLKGFQKNENTYKSAFIPDIVSLSKECVWKGIRNVGISVCPFKYYPSENRLLVLDKFILEVNFLRQKSTILQEEKNNYGLFNNFVYRDYPTIQEMNQNVNSGNDYNYLIIIENSSNTSNTVFEESLKNFKMWKALKGYKTTVVSTNTTGTSADEIRNYIVGQRNNGIEYVLLVGDNNKITLSSVNSFGGSGSVAGDYWYGCDTNNDLADIPIGRFSISSTSDFVNMVKKTIRYENSFNCSGNTLLVSHWEGFSYYPSYQWYCESIKNANYTNPMSFHTAYGGENATNSDVIGHINEGDNIINYRGHAGVSYWGDGAYSPYTWNNAGESFESTQINNMDSTTCSVFFCVACNTGNIADTTDCMLETFTRSNHGAVAFIGSTYASETGANNNYNLYLFQKLLNDGIYNLGQLNLMAHYSNIILNPQNLTYVNNAKNNAYSYICGGDPSLELWTDVPCSISNVSVTSNNGFITVNTGLSGGYYIAIASENGDCLGKINCSTSTCSFPIPAGKFYFAINKHNYRPYVIYYDAESEYIQDVVFNYDAYYESTPSYLNQYEPLLIGNGVTAEIEGGDVIVKNGHKLIVKNGPGGVFIDAGFKCEKGAIFEVK